MKTVLNAVGVACMCLIAAHSTVGYADTPGCSPISSLPLTITSPGVYCFTGNLRTNQINGQAITVVAGYVTIDLNGWLLDGSDGGSSSVATGIYSAQQHTTVRNGTVAGFLRGIQISGAGSAVERVVVDSNRYAGIFSNGPGAAITDNHVTNTGGQTQANYVYGIASTGAGAMIAGNHVWNVWNTYGGIEYGIYAVGANNAVRTNVVTDLDRPSVYGSYSYGIFQQNGSAVGNEVTNFATCYYANGIYANNVAYNCTVNYALVGTAGSGNSP